MLPQEFANAIVDAMRRFGYKVFTGPGQLNIVYVEGANADGVPNGNAPNRFNDRRILIRFDSGQPKIVGNWEATSEPGRWFTDNKLNPKGAARIKLGQWTAWRVGQHPRAGGHEALVQDLDLTVCRDGNRDYSRAGDFEDTGLFGINQHWGYDLEVANIGKASAGCLVGRTTQGHKEFMALLKTDPRYQADKKFVFTTTVMTVADLDGVQAPAPTRPNPPIVAPQHLEEEEEEETEEGMYSLTWLPAVLRAAGLKVVEQPGWQDRGHGDVGVIRGVMCHHTAGAKTGNAPSLHVVQNGRPDLAGPLSQLVLGRDGTYYVVAAGLCYHAGAGMWQGLKSGNASFIGIEAENTGRTDDPWPAVQMDAYRRGVAALLKKVKAPVIMAVGHKEYALPKGRKPDPWFDMNKFRSDVAVLMGQAAPPTVTAPTVVAPNTPLFERKAPKIMADLIRDFQLTEVQAAGILGNIGHECGGFTLMQEQHPTSGAGGYGWAQWTGVRRTAFFNWCQEQGLSVDSDEGNYGFLKHELTNTWEKRAITAVKATKDLNAAMLAFEQSYERAGIKHYDSRLTYAQRALSAYQLSKTTVTPAEDKAKTTVGTILGGAGMGGLTAGIHQDWGLLEWALALMAFVILCGVVYVGYRLVVRWFNRDQQPTPLPPVEEDVPTTVEESMHVSDTAVSGEPVPIAPRVVPPENELMPANPLQIKEWFDQEAKKVVTNQPHVEPTEPTAAPVAKKIERFRPKTKRKAVRRKKAKK